MYCVRIRFFHTDAFRLAAIYTAVFALSVAGLGFSALWIARDALDNQILQFARADIAAVQSGYASERIPEAVEVIQQRLSAPGASDYFLLQRDGRAIAGNHKPIPVQTGDVRLREEGREILGVGRMLAPGLYVFCGSNLARVRATEARIRDTMLWLFAAALLMAAGGGALVSRAFLRRSDAMARACRAIMDGDMKARIPLRGTQDEMDRLAATINEMLDRIAALVENLRQVSNDVAHDLRTPVTHLRHGLERALHGTAAGHAAALQEAIRKTDEILELFAALLRIAQIESGARREAFAALDLKALLLELRGLFGPVAEESGHRLLLDAPQPAVIQGDRALLTQLFSNLIENAILHTPPGTTITLVLADGGTPRVTLGDNGPGAAPDEKQKLFRRFYRGETSRTRPGHGLGLALATAIAELHGATLTLRDDGAPGLWIDLDFPRDGAGPP
jgi:signal transduction histidine kinase